MQNNFISLNIKYLLNTNNFSQNDFGDIFELKRGVINHYVSGKVMPKIETIQKICDYFNISIDDFINKDLSLLEKKNYPVQISQNQILANEPGYGGMIVAELEKEINQLKTKLITAYEKIDELKNELLKKNTNSKNNLQKGA